MKKNKANSKKKKPFFTIILYLFLFSLIASFIFIYHFQKKLGPELIKCAENQVKYLESLVINNSIRKYQKATNNTSFLKKNENNQNITMIEYDTKSINEAKIKITEILEKDLLNMMKGNLKEIDLNLDKITKDYYEQIEDGIIFTVSVGTATGNSLLANIGPKIPLKLKLVGNVNSEIESKVSEYGLNNAMIEIDIKVTTTTIIQMPFLSKEITIVNNIPLNMQIIQGNLPEYYIGNQKISS